MNIGRSTGRPRVVVVGGGITGLTAAYRLRRDCDVTVFDSAPVVGGKLQTASFRQHFVDVGPDAFITRNDAAVKLADELGLSNRLIAPSATRAAVYARGAVRPLPKGLAIGIPTDPVALARSGIVSWRSLLYAARDLTTRQRVAPSDYATRSQSGTFDPSVAELVGGRLGNEVLSGLVDPLIGGINAGDVRALSFAAALPQFVPSVAGKHSLMRALAPGPRATSSPAPKPVFNGVTGGISTITERLVEQCRSAGVAVRTSCPVTGLSYQKSAASLWEVHFAGGSELCDSVVMAAPAHTSASLLAPLSLPLSESLAAIEYSSVATVTFAWDRSALFDAWPQQRADVGQLDVSCTAGVLVDRQYGNLVTAFSFTSSKWPDSSSPEEFLLRASVGRHGDERAFALDDADLVDAVRAELLGVLGIDAEPLEVTVQRFERAFPQYSVGHLARVQRIEELSGQLSGLEFAGAALHGIGIPACIDSATAAAKHVLERKR